MSHSSDSAHDHGHDILDEHHHLNQLLLRLDDTRLIEDFIPLLDELRGLLLPHFAHEEGPGGLVDLVQNAAPHRLGHLDQLMVEHKQIARTLNQIQQNARRCLMDIKDVVADSHKLAALLRDHENRENELISEALMQDLGGGD